MKILYLIPARAGSKRLAGKNTKILGDKPLIVHTIDFALKNIKDGDALCISTNDDEVLAIAEGIGIGIPFTRPEELASDTTSSYDVIMHALQHYEYCNQYFDLVLLLQPTSPFRSQHDFDALIQSYQEDVEMVVSVKKSKENPYFTLFEENESGFLDKSKEGNFQRRQDFTDVFAFNGSMYLLKVSALKNRTISEFKRIKKIVIPEERSIDIDTEFDFFMAENILKYYKN